MSHCISKQVADGNQTESAGIDIRCALVEYLDTTQGGKHRCISHPCRHARSECNRIEH
jgi:hypothetical protein